MTIDRRLFTKLEPIFEQNIITLGQTYGGTLINSVKAGYEYLRGVGGGTLVVPYGQYSHNDLDPTYGYFLSSWSSQASQHHSFRILGIPNGSGELPEFVMPYPIGRPAAFQFGIPGDSPQTFTSVLRVEKIRTDGFWNGCFDVRARKLAIIDCDLQGPFPQDWIGPWPTYGATTRSGITFAQTHHRSDHKDHATIFILIGTRLDNWGDFGNQKHHCYISGATRQENSLFVYLDNTLSNPHGSHSFKSPGCGTIICAQNNIDTAGGSQAFDALNWTKKVYFQDNTVYLGYADATPTSKNYIPPAATQAWVKHWHPDLGGGHYVALSYPTYGNPDTEDAWYAYDWQALRDADGDGSSYLNNVQCFTNNTYIVRHQYSPNPSGVMHYHTMAPMSRTNYSEDYGYALPLSDRDWHDPGILAYGNNTLIGARSSVTWVTPRWDAINYGTYPEIWNEPVKLNLGGNNAETVELPVWSRFDPDTEPTYLRFRGELDELYNLPSDTTAPGVVSNIAHGTATTTSIPLTWDNPTDDAFFITVVRMSKTGYPATHEDGIPVYIGPNDTWTVGRLDHSTQYYFTFFTRSKTCNYSAGVQFTASTAVKTGDTTPPSPVSNLTVVSSASNILTLSWENPEDVTRVVVRNCAAGYPGSRWADTLVYDGPGETVDHIYRITNQATDYYSVWCADANDNWSTAVHAVATATILPATGFNISVSGTTASLSWANPPQTDFAFVQVLRSTTTFPAYNDPGSGVTLVYQGTNTSYDDVGLMDDTTYYYTVLAFNSRSMASDTKATATAILGTGIGDVTPPGVVANIQATVGKNSIGFLWVNPSDADFSNTVIRRGTTTFPATHTDGTGVFDGNANNFTDSGLTADTEYRYSFFTRDTSGNYSARVEYVVRTAIDDSDVTPPGQVIVTEYIIHDTTLYFYWTDPVDNDFDHVAMRWSTTGYPQNPSQGYGNNFGPGIGVYGSGPAGLIPGTRYYVSLFAVDTSGNVSEPTQLELVTTGGSFDPTPPDPVTNISYITTSNSVILSWVNPGDSDFLETIVRYSTEGYVGFPTQGTYAYTGQNQIVEVLGLSNNTRYYFTFFTKDDSGNYSDPVFQGVTLGTVNDLVPPGVVTNLVVTEDNYDVTMTWENPVDSDFSNTIVRKSTSGYPVSVTDGSSVYSGTGTTCTDTIIDGATYYTIFTIDESQNYNIGYKVFMLSGSDFNISIDSRKGLAKTNAVICLIF